MVLKTLKDLMDYDKDKELRNRIRQEAIKWIGEDIKEGDKNSNVDLIIKWQKRFNLMEDEAFNITEEDLK